jgi:hypothetical protein
MKIIARIQIENMFGGFVANAIDAAIAHSPLARVEAFESQNGVSPSPARMVLVSFLTMLIVLAILLFAGKYLWNNVLVDMISIAKPVKSVWQLLGLAILISLLHPGCCAAY